MTQYARGRRKEWAVVKALRDAGWLAQRSAGSHGLWDVVAVKRSRPVLFVQVKYSKGSRGWQDENSGALLKLANEHDVPADYQVWHYVYGDAAPHVYEATPGGWEAATS